MLFDIVGLILVTALYSASADYHDGGFMRRTLQLAVFGLFVLFSVCGRALADPCDLIAKYGKPERRIDMSDEDRSSAVINWLQQFTTLEEARKASTEIGISIPDIIGLDFGNDEEGWSKFQQYIHTYYSTSQSEHQKHYHFTERMSDKWYEAMEQCLSQKGVHVWIEYTESPKLFRIAAVYNSYGVPPKAKIQEFSVWPKTVILDGKALKKGKKLDGATRRVNCIRTDSSAVIISFNCDIDPIGAGELHLPAIKKYIPPPPIPKPRWVVEDRAIPSREFGWRPMHWTGGDRDFDGQASVFVSSHLEVSADSMRVYVRLFMEALEGNDNWTTVEGWSPIGEDKVIYAANADERIVSIGSAVQDEWRFVDTNHEENIMRREDWERRPSSPFTKPFIDAVLKQTTNNHFVDQWAVVSDTDDGDEMWHVFVRARLYPLTFKVLKRRF